MKDGTSPSSLCVYRSSGASMEHCQLMMVCGTLPLPPQGTCLHALLSSIVSMRSDAVVLSFWNFCFEHNMIGYF